MNIEFVVENNIDQIVKLNETVHNAHYFSHPEAFKPYDRDKFKIWFTDILSNENTDCVFVIKDEKYIGYALLIHKKISATNPFNVTSYEILHVDQMSIDQEYQNMGIGKKLISHIQSIAQERGIKRIQLDVWSDNEQASHFYKKSGFTTIREIMEIKLDLE